MAVFWLNQIFTKRISSNADGNKVLKFFYYDSVANLFKPNCYD